jgi:hypothetical protein
MGNCFASDWHPFVDESDEPFKLEYYDDVSISTSYEGKFYDYNKTTCYCEEIANYYKRKTGITITPIRKIPMRGEMFIDDGESFIRVSGSGRFPCGICEVASSATLYKRADRSYLMYSEKPLKWSIVENNVRNEPISKISIRFTIVNVPNFGYILNPGDTEARGIFYLPDHTIIPPNGMVNGTSYRCHFVVNTVEDGAVGIFKLGYKIEYIAKNENGKDVKLSLIKRIWQNKYQNEYGIITLTNTGAEFISNSTGRKTKAAVRDTQLL